MITTTPHERVAAEIRAELARQGIPQTKVADALRLSQVAISRRLLGRVPLDVNELTAIADLLGKSPSDFLIVLSSPEQASA